MLISISKISILAVLVLFGCGERQLVEQENSAPLRKATPIGLSEQPATFAGFQILWRGDVTPEEMAAVLSAVRESRKAKAALTELDHQRLRPAREAMHLAQSAAMSERAARDADDSRLARETRKQKSLAWFTGRLAAAEQEFGIGIDAAAAQQNFRAYCEAKIWELAVSPLSQLSLSARPTIVSVCEEVVAPLFKDSERCAAEAAGKSYFQCLWHDGVMQTEFFRDRHKKPCSATVATAKAESIASWVDSGLVQRILADARVGAMFKDAVMRRQRIPSPVKDAFPEVANCLQAFRSDLPVTGIYDESPAQLRDNVEAFEITGTKYRIIPETGEVNQDYARWSFLAGKLKLLAERSSGKASADDAMFWETAEPLEVDLTFVRQDAAFADWFETATRQPSETEIAATNAQQFYQALKVEYEAMALGLAATLAEGVAAAQFAGTAFLPVLATAKDGGLNLALNGRALVSASRPGTFLLQSRDDLPMLARQPDQPYFSEASIPAETAQLACRLYRSSFVSAAPTIELLTGDCFLSGLNAHGFLVADTFQDARLVND